MIYIKTQTGFAGLADGKPFTVADTHPCFGEIEQAIRNNNEQLVHQLINRSTMLATNPHVVHQRVEVDPVAGVIYVDGLPIENTLVSRVISMALEGYQIESMVAFIDNLYQNPSKKTIDRIYAWLEAGEMPITDDGHFIAYKRVNNDLTSFYDNTTKHVVGEVTAMERYRCDDRTEETCSTGLHFCSYGYLSKYYSGMGRILVLKINPADVVAIPDDYGTSKGRACKYLVVGELTIEQTSEVETVNVLSMPVMIIDEQDTIPEEPTTSPTYEQGYVRGYAVARQQKFIPDMPDDANSDYIEGHSAGYSDGIYHKKRMYR